MNTKSYITINITTYVIIWITLSRIKKTNAYNKTFICIICLSYLEVSESI